MRAFSELGETEETLAVCDTSEEAQAALAADKTVLVGDLANLRGLPVDIIVAATGIPTVDAEVAADAISEGKHVCMVSKEAESVAGPILAKMAREADKLCRKFKIGDYDPRRQREEESSDDEDD